MIFTGATAVATGGIAYGGIKPWKATERATQAADRALTRRQAEGVDLSFDVFDQSDPNDEDADDEVHMALVTNKSRRPIRDVSCVGTVGATVIAAGSSWIGLRLYWNAKAKRNEDRDRCAHEIESAERAQARLFSAWSEPGRRYSFAVVKNNSDGPIGTAS